MASMIAPRKPSMLVGAASAATPPKVPSGPVLVPPMKSWSYSSLSVFEQCKYRSYLSRVLKVPEPERPLPPGKTEHANDRGSRVHDGAELFVRSKGKMLQEMRHFEFEFLALQRMFKEGIVQLEGEWGVDKEWGEAEWKKAWLRLKLDALVMRSDTEAVVIDYKTGRKDGNEIKHAEQMNLYQLVTFLRFPNLEVVHVELWYLDKNEITTMTFRRHQGLRFRKNWDMRGGNMTSAVDFPANPSVWACKWCPYGPAPKGTGHCERGV